MEGVHDGVFLGGIFFEADGFGEVLGGAFPLAAGSVNSADALEGLSLLRIGFYGTIEGVHRLGGSGLFH